MTLSENQIDYARLKATTEILALWERYKDAAYVRRAIHIRALDPSAEHLHCLHLDSVVDEVIPNN